MSLERVFRDLFPISDVNGKYALDFMGYSPGRPEVLGRGVHRARHDLRGPAQGQARLDVFEEVDGQRRLKNQIEREVYLGELPIMTPWAPS